MLKKGCAYCAKVALAPYDDDHPSVPANVRLVAVSRDELADSHGVVYKLTELFRRRTEWYLQELDGFNPDPVKKPLLRDLVWETVCAYPDLTLAELHSRLTGTSLRGKVPIDSVSHQLSEDTRIEMFKDGTKVDKLRHNARYCTFRPKGWKS